MLSAVILGTSQMTTVFAAGMIEAVGCRVVCIIGSVISSFSFACSTLSQNVTTLIFTYGFFGGIGFGMIGMSSIIICSVYFEKKRALATGIFRSGSSIGVMIMSFMTAIILPNYRWQVLAWIYAIMCVVICTGSGMVMKPFYMETITRCNDDNVGGSMTETDPLNQRTDNSGKYYWYITLQHMSGVCNV